MKSLTEYRRLGTCVCCALAMWPIQTFAEDAAVAVAAVKTMGSMDVIEDAFATPFGATGRVDPGLLETQRGGHDAATFTVNNDIQTSGMVSNNQAWNLSTGANSIADGAFVGANGLSTVVQNSGNNVLIQNSTIINIQLQ